MSKASFIIGIVTLLVSLVPCLNYVAPEASIAGIVLGIIAMIRSKKTGGKDKKALWGVILSSVALTLSVISIFCYVVALEVLEQKERSSHRDYDSPSYSYEEFDDCDEDEDCDD